MKDKSVTEVVSWLEANLRYTLLAVDHWDADKCAVGVARPENPQQLAYISTHGREHQRYFVELESPPSGDSDMPYTMVGRHKDADRETLLKIVHQHLSVLRSSK